MTDWGTWANSGEHPRYLVPKGRRGRRKCLLANGCQNKATVMGCANGLGLTYACEFHGRMWMRDGAT